MTVAPRLAGMADRGRQIAERSRHLLIAVHLRESAQQQKGLQVLQRRRLGPLGPQYQRLHNEQLHFRPTTGR